jgi:hypothetical protein
MQPTWRPVGDLERAQLQLERLVALAEPLVTTATRDLACLLVHRGRRDEALTMLRAYVASDAGKAAAEAAAAAAAPPQLPPGVMMSSLVPGALTPWQAQFAQAEQAALEALLLELERTRLERTFTESDGDSK